MAEVYEAVSPPVETVTVSANRTAEIVDYCRRNPELLVFSTIQPVIFVLMFRYVFGGAIRAGVPGGYVNYLLPGVVGQTAAFASMANANERDLRGCR